MTEFLEKLASCGQLARVAVDVQTEQEIAEISRRTNASGGPAVLFERPAGRETAVVTNLFATDARVHLAMGCDSADEVAGRLAQQPEIEARRNWFSRLATSATAAPLDRFRAKEVKAAACQQVVRLGGDIDLESLPALRSWPAESHRSFTWAMVVVSSPDRDWHIVQRHTLPILAPDQVAIRWDPYSRPRRWLEAWRARGERMPVAVYLGGGGAAMLLDDLPLGDCDQPYTLAGLLADRPLEVAACRTHGLPVPAGAEIVMEGYVDPEEPTHNVEAVAAPTGFYRAWRDAFRLHVLALTQRSNAVLPAAISAPPPNEFSAVGRLAARLLIPLAQAAAPEIVDLAVPDFAAGRGCVFVAIDKSRPFQARKVAGTLWGLDPLEVCKLMVVVDASVDVRRAPAVLAEVLANVDPARDVYFQDGRSEAHDHAGGFDSSGRKIGLDATTKLPEERGLAPNDPHWKETARLAVAAEIQALVARRWDEYGLPK